MKSWPPLSLAFRSWFSIAVIMGTAPAAMGAAGLDATGKLKVEPVVPIQVQAFPLQQVRLLDGPFKKAEELDRQYLLSLDPDRLLHTFRLNAGLSSSAKPYGGWEEPKGELRGHFAGHYLTACALMYASTGDEKLKQKAAAVVAGMAECQAKLGSGYLSAYPESFFDRVENQQQVWAPYYTLHKIFAGLLDAYLYCDNTQALEVCRKFGDWAIARNARLSEDKMQKMLGAEHGGINESLAKLYAVTGEQKYLAISKRFNHQAVIGPASQQQDRLTGLHANTQIPKFVGTALQYELTGEPSLKAASLFFWNNVVHERSYVIGGHSDGEHFSPKEKLSEALGPSTTETCNTYNMLKLTRHLFSWDPKAEYADYYERALLNHILCSQNPADGMMCYYVPLRSGSAKGGRGYGYNTPEASFWCCTGTGVENHAKYGDSIYFWDGQETLYVNLFIASELRIPEAGITLRQETKFPDEDSTRFLIKMEQPVQGTLKLRHPAWATAGITITVNGQKQDLQSKPGSYVDLRREWKDGDLVEMKMPFMLKTEGFRDNPKRFAFLNGPVVLCSEVDPSKPFPAIVADTPTTLASLKAIPGKANQFQGPTDIFRSSGASSSGGITLEPFYTMHGERHYVVYFDQFSEAQWKAKQKEYEEELARQKVIEARSIDFVTPGHEQNERDHKMQGQETSSGDFGDRKYRHAQNGWFSYDLAVLPDQPQELWVTYWGSDASREFDVLVDGKLLVVQRLTGAHPEKFYTEITPLPEELTRGKKSVTIKFQAHPNNWAGGVFGVRMMKK